MGRNSLRPWGLEGGGEGSNNYIELLREGALTRYDRVAYLPLKQGDRVRIYTGRGGGYGQPFERPARRVAADVADGYLTRDEAAHEYGVVLDEQGAFDEAATEARRGRQ
jgi:N-methylhydantoinase B